MSIAILKNDINWIRTSASGFITTTSYITPDIKKGTIVRNLSKPNQFRPGYIEGQAGDWYSNRSSFKLEELIIIPEDTWLEEFLENLYE